MSNDGSSRLALVNGQVSTVDEHDTAFNPGFVLIRDSRIEAVGAMSDYRPSSDVEEIDCSERLVFPGFVNTHTHTFQTLIRGVGEGLPVWEWFSQALDMVVGNLTVEDARVAAEISAVESIRSGATCLVDYNYPHPKPGMDDVVLEGLQRVGIRCVLARGIIDTGDVHATVIQNTEAELAECERLISTFHRSEDDMVRVWLAPYTVFSTSPDAFRRASAMARRYGTGLTVHASTPSTLESARELFGMSDIAYEEALGVLGPEVLLVHCTHPDEWDVSAISRHGARISHNPASNAYLGEGASPVVDLMAAGIIVGLGTDGPASNNNQDMLAVLKLTALIQKLVKEDPSVITARQVLRMATIDGARCLGWDDQIGSLEPGKRADILIVNPWLPNTVAFDDPAACLVYSATQENIETVLINGRIIMKERKFVNIDVTDVMRRAQHASQELRVRSGLG